MPARTRAPARRPPVTGADTVQRVPSHHAASRLVPPGGPPAAPRCRPAARSGRAPAPGPRRAAASPADRQVPPASVKTPAAPGRAQLPAAIGFLSGPNETAVTPSSPQARPGADAARALSVVSGAHRPAAADPAVGAASIVPSCSSARVRPDGRDRDGAGRVGQRRRRAGRASSSGPRRCWWPAGRRPGSGSGGSPRPGRRRPRRRDQAAVVGHALRGDQRPAAAGRGPEEELPELVAGVRAAHDRDGPGALRGDQRGGQRRGQWRRAGAGHPAGRRARSRRSGPRRPGPRPPRPVSARPRRAAASRRLTTASAPGGRTG